MPAGEADSDRRKGNKGTVNNEYEILLLLDVELAEERQNEVISRTRELVEKGGGTWERHDPWGRRRLTYEIDKKPEGIYHLLEFSCAPSTLDEVSRVLKIDDGVMRHMATRRPQRGPGQPVAVGGPPKDDVGLVPDSSLEEE